MGRKKKRVGNPARGSVLRAQSVREAEFLRRAQSAYRESRERLRAAKDPITSKAAYEGVWESMDAMGRELLEGVEAEEAEEEPDEFEDDLGTWKTVTNDVRTCHTLRGPMRVRRGRVGITTPFAPDSPRLRPYARPTRKCNRLDVSPRSSFGPKPEVAAPRSG